MQKYKVQVRHHDRIIYGGMFDTVAEAAPVAERLRRELFTHDDF